jgi:TRAP-type mannitol/chloroaromatic compound transport system substrate-binding protein
VVGVGGDVYREAGATVIALSTAELQAALERGVVDAVHVGSPRFGEQLGFNRVAKFLYNPAFVMPSMVVDLVVNRDKWGQVPAATRELVQKACAENVLAVIAENEVADKEALKRIAAGGVSIRQMPPAIRSHLLNAALKVEADLAAGNAKARALIGTIQASRGKTLAAEVR